MLRSEVTFSQLTEHGERDLLRHRVAHAVVRGAGVPADTRMNIVTQYNANNNKFRNFTVLGGGPN